MRRRRTAQLSGLGALAALYDVSPINPTTIFTPSTGFLSTPGDITSGQIQPASSGGPGLYVTTPTSSQLPPPACSQDTRPGGAAFSDACIALDLANQAANMGQSNLASYNIDLLNCLHTYPQPPDCYQRTFGLTPVGGYTGGVNILTPNAQQFVTGIAPVQQPPAPPQQQTQQQIIPPSSTATPTARQNQVNTQSPASQTQQMMSGGGGGGSGIIDASTSFLEGDVNIAGFNVPVWALGLAAIGVVAIAAGGRH